MRKIWKPLLAVCLLLLCGLLAASGESYVSTPSGWQRADSETLTTVLTADQLRTLDLFDGLKQVDLSGSDCYAEMMAWAQAHPETELRYTVALPGGLTVENSARELDLSALDQEQAAQALPLLAYLPQLERVDLGEAARGLTPELALDYTAAYPDLDLDYRFTLFGQDLNKASRSLDLRGRGGESMEELLRYLPLMAGLETVELGDDGEAPFPWDKIAALEAACPEAEFHYDFHLFDRPFSLTDTLMDLSYVPMDDGGAAVLEAASCMPHLSYLDMDSCGISNDDMRALRDALPDTKVVWRVWFGSAYSVRTDVEKILASRPTKGGQLGPRDVDALSCCTDVRYLDVGHNELMTDISFISSMPNLEVAILSISGWSDTSPIADCPHLEYLEIQTTYATDLTPLAGLKELKHLNICHLYGLTDISPLYGLTQLRRLWIGCLDPIPEEQIEHMQEVAPYCLINTRAYDPTSDGWRFNAYGKLVPRYALLREQFDGYYATSYSYAWNDPLYKGYIY